jgi:hypothetical protein
MSGLTKASSLSETALLMQQTPKRLKRLVREWAGVAHDRELSAALLELCEHFDRWHRAEITAADLNDQIHKYHHGASREIWKHYATNHLEPAIGFAVATGILRREELPSELLEHVAGWIQFYVQQPAS